MTKKALQQATDSLEALFDFCPVELNKPGTQKAIASYKRGAAAAYADNGFREYLENAVKLSNHMLIRATTPEQMLYYKARMDAIMQIIAFGKYNFINSEMGKSSEQDRIASVESELRKTTHKQ